MASIRAFYDLELLWKDNRSTFCDNCGSDFHKHFTLGQRIHNERVWLCSPKCVQQLKLRWYPTPTKPNRSLWQFITHMIGG